MADLRFAPSQLSERGADAVLARGAKAWPVFAQIVSIGSVQNEPVAATRGDGIQSIPELGLAEIAALSRVLEIPRVTQLPGLDVEQWDVECSSESFCGVRLKGGIRCAPTDDGEKPL
jgi:hypothetical protein